MFKATSLFLTGILGHLMLFNRSKIVRFLLGQSGEAGDAGKGEAGAAGKGGDAAGQALTQEQVDKIVQSRLAREREKYADYDDLRKFKTEYEQQNEKQKHEDLVRQKKYEEAEKSYQTKITEFQGLVSKKDQEIIDLKINHHLTNEISKQNGFIEESAALLRGAATIDSSGQVVLKTRDANGIEQLVPVNEGVKKFLTERPHLVKSTHKAGSGSTSDGAAGGSAAGGSQGETESLGDQLQKARASGDFKKIEEIKRQLRGKYSGSRAMV